MHFCVYNWFLRASIYISDEDIEIGDIEDGPIDERSVNMDDDVTNDINKSFMNDIDERYVDDSQDDYWFKILVQL